MITFRKTAALASTLALGLALGGCVTVFPKAKPAQLYRFGLMAAAMPVTTASAAPVNVARASTAFVAAASSDRILTSNGDQTAYIADARWVSAATVLFDEAETRAFATPGGPVRLIARGQIASAPFSLKLDVQSFEAQYLDGLGAPPTVVITISGDLTRLADGQLAGSRVFEIRKRASENRVGAIVEAFDAATSDSLSQIAGWTAERAAATPTRP